MLIYRNVYLCTSFHIGFGIQKVQRGKNKSYKDLSGNICVKQGADKRRITENREILSLFQDAGEFYPDELGIDGTSADDLDTKALNRFFENVYQKPMKDFKVPEDVLLKKYTHNGCQGTYGNSIAGTEYRDSRE